jgi:hypothetical protein
VRTPLQKVEVQKADSEAPSGEPKTGRRVTRIGVCTIKPPGGAESGISDDFEELSATKMISSQSPIK